MPTNDPFAALEGEESSEGSPFDALGAIEPASADKEEATGSIKYEELKAVADKYGTDPSTLTEFAESRGYSVDGISGTDIRSTLAGPADALFMHIPSWILKKAQDEPTEKAIDELSDILAQRRTGYQAVSQIGGTLAGGLLSGGATLAFAKAAGLGARATTGLAVGQGALETGAYELAQSRSDEELEAFLRGTAFGAVGGVAIAGGMAALSAGYRAGKAAGAKYFSLLPDDPKLIAEIEENAVKSYMANKPYEQQLEAIFLKGDDQLLKPKGFDTFKEMVRDVKMPLVGDEKLVAKYAKKLKRDITPDEIPALMLQHQMKGDYRRLVKRITGKKNYKEALEELPNAKAGYGDEILRAKVAHYRMMDRYADNIKMVGAPKRDRWRDVVFRKFSDQTYVFREIEDRTGLPLTLLSHRLSDSSRAVSNSVAEGRKLGNELFANTKKLGVDAARVVDLVEDLDMYKAASASEKQVADSWKKLWSDLRDKVNKMGLKIDDEGEQYMRRQLLPKRELIKNLVEETKKVGDEAKALKQYLAGSDQHRDYFDGLTSVLRKPVTDMEDVSRAKAIIMNPAEDTIERTYRVSPGIDRTALPMPDWVRDKNPYRLLDSWLNQTMRAVHMHEPLTQLETYQMALKAAGFVDDANYIDSILADLMGVSRRNRSSVAYAAGKAVQNFKTAATLRALEAEDPVSKSFWSAAAYTPDMLAFAQQQLYPTYMGLRVDNVIRNLTQPYTMSAALLGYGNVFRAHLKMASGQVPRNYTQFLKSKGLVSEYRQFEAIGWIEDGLIKHFSPDSKARRFIDGLNNVAMYMYTKSDTINRMTTWHAAGYWAKKAVAKDAKALAAVDKLPGSYRRRILNAIDQGDEELAHDLMGRYTIATTQFNYDRVSMSEYGRFMGGMFSMFTKWPTSIGGEIAYKVRKDGYMAAFDVADREMMMKYWGPLIAFGMAEGFMKTTGLDTDLKKQVVGYDVSSWAPMTSLFPRGGTAGELLSSPALDLGIQASQNVIGALSDPESAPESFMRAGSQAAAFIPGKVWFDFVLADIPRWYNNTIGDK